LPALLGRRRVGAGRAVGFAGKQGGTAELYFLSLFPSGNKDFLFLETQNSLSVFADCIRAFQ